MVSIVSKSLGGPEKPSFWAYRLPPHLLCWVRVVCVRVSVCPACMLFVCGVWVDDLGVSCGMYGHHSLIELISGLPAD